MSVKKYQLKGTCSFQWPSRRQARRVGKIAIIVLVFLSLFLNLRLLCKFKSQKLSNQVQHSQMRSNINSLTSKLNRLSEEIELRLDASVFGNRLENIQTIKEELNYANERIKKLEDSLQRMKRQKDSGFNFKKLEEQFENNFSQQNFKEKMKQFWKSMF